MDTLSNNPPWSGLPRGGVANSIHGAIHPARFDLRDFTIRWELAGWIEKRNRFIPFVVVKTLDATWLRTVGLVACDPMSRPMLNDFLNWMVFRQGRT